MIRTMHKVRVDDYVDVDCPQCDGVIAEFNCNRCGTLAFSDAMVNLATDHRKVKIILKEARDVLDTLDGAGYGQVTVIDDSLFVIHKALQIISHPDATPIEKSKAWHYLYIASVAAAACAKSNAEQTCGDFGLKDGYICLQQIADGCTPRTEPEMGRGAEA